MESTPDQAAEGMVMVRVLAEVLERLVSANSRIAETDPVQVTKFHALKAPSIGIAQYLERIHKYASCSTECFVLALIYIDRLIQRNNFLLTELNVHRVVITAVLLAAKFFDDAYYNNAYYAKVGGVLVSEMNSLEVEFLFRINFSLHASPELFHKYRAELIAHALGAGLVRQSIGDVLKAPQVQYALESSSPHVQPVDGRNLREFRHCSVENNAVHQYTAPLLGQPEMYNSVHMLHVTPSPTQNQAPMVNMTASHRALSIIEPTMRQVTSMPIPNFNGVPSVPINAIVHHDHTTPILAQQGPIAAISQRAIHVPDTTILNSSVGETVQSSHMITPLNSTSSNVYPAAMHRRNSGLGISSALPQAPSDIESIIVNEALQDAQYVAHYHHLNNIQAQRADIELSRLIHNYATECQSYQPDISHMPGCGMEKSDPSAVSYNDFPPKSSIMPFGHPQFVETTSPLLVPGAGPMIAGSFR